MDCLAELDAAFHRLLLEPDTRTRLEHAPDSLGWSSRVTRLMTDAGVEDFRKLGGAIVKGVGSGSLCGMDLRSAFRVTIGRMSPASANAVLELFIASPEFRQVRAVGNVAGYSPARAFYAWVCAAEAPPEVLASAQREYVHATLLALASTGTAYFSPDDPLIHAVDGGWIAVLDGTRQLPGAEAVPESPVAAGAVRGRFWSIPLSHRSAAALLWATSEPPHWATARLPYQEAAPLLSAMRTKGMV